MVEPACAVAEIAASGNKREIVRMWLVDMFQLHDCGSAAMCASNHEFGADCQPVTRSRRRETTWYVIHQRNSRGPNAAPARVHSTIVPPYQSAINGSESSVQWSAYAIALTPPAIRPANAPARTR